MSRVKTIVVKEIIEDPMKDYVKVWQGEYATEQRTPYGKLYTEYSREQIMNENIKFVIGD
jgi:hypothetical protein